MYQQFSVASSSDYGQMILPASAAGPSTIAPHATTTTSAATAAAPKSQPLVATGDWTTELVQLAKTAELKKHSLTLQLHTANIVAAHNTLEQKDKAIQDIKEQKNRLDSERVRLLNALAEINADRDKVDLLEASITRECADLRQQIQTLQDGEYAVAKRDVDRLRVELGQPPLPPLQTKLDEKTSQYLRDRRVTGEKRTVSDSPTDIPPVTTKRPRGRPKGSKNRGGKAGGNAASGSASATAGAA
ncbi:hypothetical protein AZE42_03562 [Rhizopogon vesiculosus]|uniref:Uncharacterized protein n=1 Tax=Rhizopogon vesiculosus TaxID=180088 RepID=A0A1J8R5J9_9AGAM|nr:hypothetical protein AZE42_03562 [Rhizopogon vesiculosus]